MNPLFYILALALAAAGFLLGRHTPPPSAKTGGKTPPSADGGISRAPSRAIARETVRQEHQNFLHYDGSPQPPIDPYQAAHHAVR